MKYNKFDSMVTTILEDNMAGDGGVFGSAEQPIYNPPTDTTSGDKYAENDHRNLFGVYGSMTKKSKKKKKNQKSKVFPKIVRRNFPETFLGK
jgi:hypothetical protein